MRDRRRRRYTEVTWRQQQQQLTVENVPRSSRVPRRICGSLSIKARKTDLQGDTRGPPGFVGLVAGNKECRTGSDEAVDRSRAGSDARGVLRDSRGQIYYTNSRGEQRTSQQNAIGEGTPPPHPSPPPGRVLRLRNKMEGRKSHARRGKRNDEISEGYCAVEDS
ncbi:hypothetical protein NHX12_004815 [Muraenolepis orangiensis]|uniref:Uncharacterized protein n=1 Tax=Muraenolepis orangiensis TaxID=630683 RepID=A0A9Q0ICL3_9TELE|nr:hypothetical protein NHX12_004815 [Muraenolepis orangiensis]